MASSRLVLARFGEDVSWVPSYMEHNWGCDIVTKGAPVTNWGREQSSYLWWITTHWRLLPELETVCFAQAHPFDHVRDFRLRHADRFTPMGTVAHTVMGEPLDQFVAYEWERIIGAPFPHGGVDFPAGSCFSTPASRILMRGRTFYDELLEYATRTPVFHAHVIERLWPGVLS